MASRLEDYLAQIRAMQPGILIKTAVMNSDGLINDVVVVNGETVFRFARDEHGARALVAELRVLEAIHGRVHLPAPLPGYTQNGVVSYPLLCEPLSAVVSAA